MESRELDWFYGRLIKQLKDELSQITGEENKEIENI